MTNTISVRVEIIRWGDRQFEVAFSVKGESRLFVTFPTAESILNYRENSVREKLASKSLKAFLGEGLSVGKSSGLIVNKPALSGATAKVNLIELHEFVALASWEAYENRNQQVARMLAAGCEDSFRSIAYEQIGEKLDIEERNERIAVRLETKDLFWVLGTAIKETREAVGKEVAFFHYTSAFDAINRGLFGKTSKDIKTELGISKGDLNRDHFGFQSLSRIKTVQDVAARRIRRGEKPCDAIKATIESMLWDVIDYRN